MYQKALTFGDQDAANAILTEPDPNKVKKIGRRVKNFVAEEWSAVAFSIVVRGNYYKFAEHPTYRAYLIGTEDQVLVEASPHDRIWGIGMTAEEASQLDDPYLWRGSNWLGYALMEARDELRR